MPYTPPTLTYANLAPTWSAVRAGTTLIPICMFHDVDSTHLNDLDMILVRGFTTVTLNDVLAYLQRGTLASGAAFPTKPIVLTYDDGYVSQYSIAYPALVARTMQATLFVIGGWIGNTAAAGSTYGVQHLTSSARPFTWANAIEMYGSGLVDIQCHTNLHWNAGERSDGQWLTDVSDGQAAILANVPGHTGVKHFCWPQGIVTASKRAQMVGQGIVTASEVEDFATEQYLFNHRVTDPMRLSRMSGATVAYLDGVTFDADPRAPKNNNWDFRRASPGGITYDWGVSGTSANLSYPNEGLNGKRCAKIVCAVADTTNLFTSQFRFPMFWSSYYAIAARYQYALTSGNFKIYLRSYDKTGAQLQTVTLLTVTGPATQASWSSTFPIVATIPGSDPGASYAQVRVALEGAVGTLWLDELDVRPFVSSLPNPEGQT